VAQWIEQRFPKPLVAGSIPAGGAYKNKDLDEPLVPPVIKKGLVPRNGEESAAGEGILAERSMLARASGSSNRVVVGH
jgi:hypothetical protein